MIPKIKRTNLSEQIVDAVIEMIENGTLKSGEKLPNELELAASFQVSRNIMREAMRVLVNYDILDSKVGVGTFVSSMALSNIQGLRYYNNLRNNTSVEELMEARLIIEPALCKLACQRCTEDDIAQLEAQVASDSVMKNSYEADNYGFNFHIFIAHLSGNDILEHLLVTIIAKLRDATYEQMPLYMPPEVISAEVEQHRSILGAIKRRDGDAAQQIMYDHLNNRIHTITEAFISDEKTNR